MTNASDWGRGLRGAGIVLLANALVFGFFWLRRPEPVAAPVQPALAAPTPHAATAESVGQLAQLRGGDADGRRKALATLLLDRGDAVAAASQDLASHGCSEHVLDLVVALVAPGVTTQQATALAGPLVAVASSSAEQPASARCAARAWQIVAALLDSSELDPGAAGKMLWPRLQAARSEAWTLGFVEALDAVAPEQSGWPDRFEALVQAELHPAAQGAACRALTRRRQGLPAFAASFASMPPSVQLCLLKQEGRAAELSRAALSAADVRVRVAAVEIVGGTGEPEDVPALAARLGSEAPSLREREALEQAAIVLLLEHPERSHELLAAFEGLPGVAARLRAAAEAGTAEFESPLERRLCDVIALPGQRLDLAAAQAAHGPAVTLCLRPGRWPQTLRVTRGGARLVALQPGAVLEGLELDAAAVVVGVVAEAGIQVHAGGSVLIGTPPAEGAGLASSFVASAQGPLRVPAGAEGLVRLAPELPLRERGLRGGAVGWVDRGAIGAAAKTLLSADLEVPALPSLDPPALEPHRSVGRGLWAPVFAPVVPGQPITLVPWNTAPWTFEDPGWLLQAADLP